MLKFYTALLLALTFSTAVFSVDEDSQQGSPMRRTPAMATKDQISDGLLSDDPVEKLSTMVTCYHECQETHNITLWQIRRLIKQNPENANPYIKKYEAHLIALASRRGLLDIVQLISCYNPPSIHCQDKDGHTPLDEAILFKKADVAKYLHTFKASQNHTTNEQYNALCPPKKRKREI